MNFLNRHFFRAVYFSIVLALVGKTSAAIVGPTGYTNSFSSQPTAADWATLSIPGLNSDSYDFDTDVNANIAAAGVTGGTVIGSGNPPSSSASASWVSGFLA